MFRKYYKMGEVPSLKLINEFEEHVAPTKKIRDGLIKSFNEKWNVTQPMVVDDVDNEIVIVGFRVPYDTKTPEWANRIEFTEGGTKLAFWKPNTSTDKGREFDEDLRLINDHPIYLFGDYVLKNFLKDTHNIIDENSNIHIPVAGRAYNLILLNVPVVKEDDSVQFTRLGFSEIEELEFMRIVGSI